jgi:lysophospholipase L1-like esterase
MKYSLKFFVATLFTCTILCSSSCKQDKPFYAEIEAFKKADKQSFPQPGGILFVGSSSFTKWTDVQNYFPGFRIINRGFGGSTLPDVIRYADDIIIPYKPKQVVIYCGDNDIAAGNILATEVLKRFMELFRIIRAKLPNANIVFVSIKPSPSRVKYLRVVEDANIMIRQFLSTYPETDYVDVYHPMLDSSGYPKSELFLDDSLHMKPNGYEIWRDAIRPHLKRY